MIYSGCDDLGVNLDNDTIDTTQGDIGIDAVVVPPDLELALLGFIEAVQLHIEESPPHLCISRPIEDVEEEADAIGARVDSMLGKVQEGLTMENFYDRIEDLDSTDWARADSAAMRTLYNETKGLDVFGCVENEEINTMADNIYAEYADILHNLGSGGLAELIDNLALGGTGVDACELTCAGVAAAGVAFHVIVSAIAMAACGPAALVCVGAIMLRKAFGISMGIFNLYKCLKICSGTPFKSDDTLR